MPNVSAQLTSLSAYPISTPFYAGKDNAIELPIVNSVGTLLDNFEVVDNHLVFTGESKEDVVLKAKVAIASQKPSAVDPIAPLDFGAKAILRVYLQVGLKKGVAVRLDETYYYPGFEYPFINYTLDLEDIFCMDSGDVVRVFAYWELAAPLTIPSTTVNPNPASTFYVTIQRANVSLIALSTEHQRSQPVVPLISSPSSQVIPLGTNLNNELYRFKPNVTGRTLVNVRMNIGETTLFDNATSQTTRVINTNWFTYLSLNGSNDRNNITYQTITNTPNLSNGNTVWPATLELYLLVDLKENDEITVKSDIVDGLAPNANPPYFRPVPNGNVNTVLTFESICTKSLVPSVQTVSHYNSTLTVPLDGKLDSALEFPVEGEVDFGDDFEIVAKKLVYRGERKQKFLVRGALNLARLTLNFPVISPPLAPPVITLQGVGFAVGVNGAKQNEVKTLTNMYTDLRYNFKWIAEENAENVVEMKQGDVLSFLVWSNNASYMTEAPDSSRSLVNPTNPIPNFTPPQGSTSSFTGLLSFVISKLER